jgi:Flp pilus assembly protein TadD
MHALLYAGRQALLAAIFAAIAIQAEVVFAQSSAGTVAADEIRIVELQGIVEVLLKGNSAWVITQTNQPLHAADRLRTRANSRVTLLWSAQSVLPLGASTEIEILPPHAPDAESGLNWLKGIGSFFHRDKPGRIRIITRGAIAGVEGTEFVINVDDSGQTTLWLIDGRVGITNTTDQVGVVITNRQKVVAAPGQLPVVTAGFNANNILQWCFYYPAVLDLRDLPLTPAETQALEASLAEYRSGDLLQALAKYPQSGPPASASDAERVYYAALLLSVGQVEQTENTLAKLSATNDERISRLATALRQLIAAVKFQAAATPPKTAATPGQLSTELLAASYYEQSLADRTIALTSALKLARQAATNSPDFGFAWARVAELEFSFGRTERALDALNKGLALAPRNAQAIALKGFLFAAKNRTREAIETFNDAIAIDSALGNAWLGRGLCRIRRGDLAGGREDLLIAAALEPQRAILRSYLGKAYGDARDFKRAEKELELAKSLDPNDPTAWLYSALLNQQRNRINEGIRDLEHSEDLNDNRSVYRSSLLLDQDRAVRSANLAAIYRDAGMFDVSVREASRAVSYDYANYSAHAFLANSYNELRDPNFINLRYETASEIEYLLANLLAPPGAGTLSPAVSQQEYSKLFQRNRLGLISDTEYLSRGAWTESGAQYGTLGTFDYSLEAFYRSDPGQRPNNDVEQRQLLLRAKQQITPKDTAYLEVTHFDASGGDLAQYFDPQGNPGFRFHEKQEPTVSLGYHREWAPGMHTLFLAAYVNDRLSLTNPAQSTLLTFVPAGTLTAVDGFNIQQHWSNRLKIYSTELQQIWETVSHTTIIGGRAQWGDLRTRNLQTDPDPIFQDFLPVPPANQDFSVDFRRMSVYGYHYWQVLDPLQLVGGVTYDHITFPESYRIAPISDAEQTVNKVSPKAGFILTPFKGSTVRFAYTRSVAGASLDQSLQIEPSQVAGFIQTYRSIIPESVAGPNAGAEFETFGLSLEQRLPTGTYLGVTGQILNSDVHRTVGNFAYDPSTGLPATPSGLKEKLDYEEDSILATVNQLVGKGWSLGARYGLTEAELIDDYSTRNAFIFNFFEPHQKTRSLMHNADLFVIYNHPSGFFAEFDALWYRQHNERTTPANPSNPATISLSGDDFWQFNALLGYRTPGRRLSVTLGILNLTDENYRLSPLTLYNDLPRGRTAAVRLLLNF